MRSNQHLYKACPKHTKLLVAKAVVKAVHEQSPPGRFLELDDTEIWRVVTPKKALDKTSQALREVFKSKEPSSPSSDFQVDISAEAQRLEERGPKKKRKKSKNESRLSDMLSVEEIEGMLYEPCRTYGPMKRKPKKEPKRRKKESFRKPDWWSTGTPVPSISLSQGMVDESEPKVKRVKPTETEEDDVVPLPVESMQTRQSSFFNFLRSSRFLGTVSPSRSSIVGASIQGTQTNVLSTANFGQMGIDNAPETDELEPLPLDSSGLQDTQAARQAIQMLQNQGGFLATQEFAQGINNLNAESTVPLAITAAAASPPNAGLKAQVSDWLNSFLPRNIDNDKREQAPVSEAPPPPPADNLGRGTSSSFLFNLARSPSQFLTNLKSGVTAFFVDSEPPGSATPEEGFPQPITLPKPSLVSQTHSFGTPSVAKKDDLLEDTDETPMEMQFRRVFPSKS